MRVYYPTFNSGMTGACKDRHEGDRAPTASVRIRTVFVLQPNITSFNYGSFMRFLAQKANIYAAGIILDIKQRSHSPGMYYAEALSQNCTPHHA